MVFRGPGATVKGFQSCAVLNGSPEMAALNLPSLELYGIGFTWFYHITQDH
jgi:hypothetical protein